MVTDQEYKAIQDQMVELQKSLKEKEETIKKYEPLAKEYPTQIEKIKTLENDAVQAKANLAKIASLEADKATASKEATAFKEKYTAVLTHSILDIAPKTTAEELNHAAPDELERMLTILKKNLPTSVPTSTPELNNHGCSAPSTVPSTKKKKSKYEDVDEVMK